MSISRLFYSLSHSLVRTRCFVYVFTTPTMLLSSLHLFALPPIRVNHSPPLLFTFKRKPPSTAKLPRFFSVLLCIFPRLFFLFVCFIDFFTSTFIFLFHSLSFRSVLLLQPVRGAYLLQQERSTPAASVSTSCYCNCPRVVRLSPSLSRLCLSYEVTAPVLSRLVFSFFFSILA